MKMMRKNWKDRKGVSPVIATILMVAITVVLAAVLYVMVMGFGGDSSNLPTGEFKTPEKTTQYSDGNTPTLEKTFVKVQVLSISEAKEVADMRLSVSNGANTPVYVVGATMTTAASGAAIDGVTVSFTDLNGDGKVSTGDYFTVTLAATADSPAKPAATGAYTVALSFSPSSGTGGVICDTTFTY